MNRSLTLQSQHFFPLAWSLDEGLGGVEGDGAVEILGVGVDGVAGGPLGGAVDGSNDMSEPATDMSPSPSSCGMSAIVDGSLADSLSGCRCRLRFAGGAGGRGRRASALSTSLEMLILQTRPYANVNIERCDFIGNLAKVFALDWSPRYDRVSFALTVHKGIVQRILSRVVTMLK